MKYELVKRVRLMKTQYDTNVEEAQALANKTGKPVGLIARLEKDGDSGRLVWYHSQEFEIHKDEIVRTIRPTNA